MIIPEDGCLSQISKKGFAAFNNVMLIKVPIKLKKPGETIFQLATLDRSKKGERWPADQYVNGVMKTPPEENSLTENSTNSIKDNNQKSNTSRNGKFLNKFKPYTKKPNNFSQKSHNQEVSRSDSAVVPTDTANLNHEFMPNAFHNSQAPHRRFHGENHAQYNDRTFNDDTYSYRYHQNQFPSDHQPYGVNKNLHTENTSLNHIENRYAVHNNLHGENSSLNHIENRYGVHNNLHGEGTSLNHIENRYSAHNLHGEGTSLNHIENRYGAQGKIISATVSREPILENRPYNDNFDSRNLPHYQPNLISPIKHPFNFQENPPPYVGPYVINPQENNFNGTEVSPNFLEIGRRTEESFVPNIYPTDNYNEVPRNQTLFPFKHSNGPKFKNNFEMPLGVGPNNGFNNRNNSRDNIPLLPAPCQPFDNFKNVSNGDFPNFNRMNSHNYQERGQQNAPYPPKNRVYCKRGREFAKRGFRGNNRRPNHRYHPKNGS